MTKLTLKFKGGPGSGNFGHSGRKGQIGGSSDGSSSSEGMNKLGGDKSLDYSNGTSYAYASKGYTREDFKSGNGSFEIPHRGGYVTIKPGTKLASTGDPKDITTITNVYEKHVTTMNNGNKGMFALAHFVEGLNFTKIDQLPKNRIGYKPPFHVNWNEGQYLPID